MAEGCDPEVDAFEDLDRVLPSCKAHLIVVADREGWCLASDGPRARS
jgi:hypothetical protein